MHLKREVTEENIEKLEKNSLNHFLIDTKNGLETSVKGNDFIFDYINFLQFLTNVIR